MDNRFDVSVFSFNKPSLGSKWLLLEENLSDIEIEYSPQSFLVFAFVVFQFLVVNQKGLESGFKFTKYLANLHINSSDN